MSERILYEGRINDHCFVPQANGEDECNYDNCKQPELAHWWTVNAKKPNPIPSNA